MDIVLVSTIAWTLAQGLKVILQTHANRRFEWSYFTSSGGFPSAHSAFVTCLMLQIGFLEGFRTGIFALAFGFWAVVVYDSFNVRYAVGIYSQILNRMGHELAKKSGTSYTPIKEILGHTPIQVLFGILFGAAIAIIRVKLFPFAVPFFLRFWRF